MTIQKLVAPQISKAAEEILIHCMLDQKRNLPDINHLKEVLNNLTIDTIETYCDTIKEQK